MSVVNSMRRRRKRKKVINHVEDLDAEKFDIFMIEDVDIIKPNRNRATIARTYSAVRRALGKIDENRKENDEKKNRMKKKRIEKKVVVVSRSRRRKLREEKKRILSSKAATIQERNRTTEEKNSFNPLNIGPLTLSNEEYTALMRC
eukprot:g4859.t1